MPSAGARGRRATQEDDVLFHTANAAASQAAGPAPMTAEPTEIQSDVLLARILSSLDDDKAEELDLGKNECAATAYAAQQQAKEAAPN